MKLDDYFILITIGICTYYICKSVLSKLTRNKSKHETILFFFAAISAPFIYLGLKFSIISAFSYYPERQFDPVRWKDLPEKRFELSKNIIDSNLLVGKTKNQVEKLLGKPMNFDINEWTYEIGFVPLLGNIDTDILIIVFKNGVVTKVEQKNT